MLFFIETVTVIDEFLFFWRGIVFQMSSLDDFPVFGSFLMLSGQLWIARISCRFPASIYSV